MMSGLQTEGSARKAQLLTAVRKGDRAAVEAILASDATLANATGDDGVPAVRLALYYRQPAIGQVLVERGATLDFWSAAAMGRTTRLRELLRDDAALVNRLSPDGATPLGLAAFFGNRESVEFLLNAGADMDRANTNPAFPFVPLHSAMSAGHAEVVDLLLARGANVNAREGGGLTVLHEAAGLGNMDYVRKLLAHGANPSAKTDEGKLPEDFAAAPQLSDVREALQKARAGR